MIPCCEFCNRNVASVEIEFLNMSEGETVTVNVCPTCAIISSHTGIRYDSDGVAYGDLGCIGGVSEEVN